MYQFLFLVRFYPFWALPVAVVFFEVGMYFYYRRMRYGVMAFMGMAAMMVVLAIAWIALEGYWRLTPVLKEFIENFGQ